jgi:hypothetical protein
MKDGLVQRGSTWSYVVRVRDPKTGRMKDQWKGGYRTRTEAKAARTMPARHRQGYGVASTRITVREYLEQWLEVQAGQVRPHDTRKLPAARRQVHRAADRSRASAAAHTRDDRLPVRDALKGGRRGQHKPKEGHKPKASL